MSWRDRIVVDGTDRAAWLRRRPFTIGASDVKGYARMESAEKYAERKLNPRKFTGNSYTANGHIFEPELVAYAMVPGNLAMVHSPDEEAFTATPDGISPNGSLLSEVKVRHGTAPSGPTGQEWRQVAWQFEIIPEGIELRFVEGVVTQGYGGRWTLQPTPKLTVITRKTPEVVKAREKVLPIAHEVLAIMQARMRQEMGF